MLPKRAKISDPNPLVRGMSYDENEMARSLYL
jgi:hypothetical protein